MKTIHLPSLLTSFAPKTTAIGIMGSIAMVALSVNAADASILGLSIQNALFTDGTSFSGSFTYDTTNNIYDNWDLITAAGSTNTPVFHYTTGANGNSFTPRTGGINTPQNFSVETNDHSRYLNLEFIDSLASLASVNATVTLHPGTSEFIVDPSLYRTLIYDSNNNHGFVKVTSITGAPQPPGAPGDPTTPEPGTLLGLGSVAALGFFSRRKKSNKS